MAIKVINNLIRPNSLVLILLVFRTYLYMAEFNAFTPIII